MTDYDNTVIIKDKILRHEDVTKLCSILYFIYVFHQCFPGCCFFFFNFPKKQLSYLIMWSCVFVLLRVSLCLKNVNQKSGAVLGLFDCPSPFGSYKGLSDD